jgi:hypothetical protein
MVLNKLNTGIFLHLFGLKRDKVTGSWIKPDNEELNEDYCILERDSV